jgi:hypothetical protein
MGKEEYSLIDEKLKIKRKIEREEEIVKRLVEGWHMEKKLKGGRKND